MLARQVLGFLPAHAVPALASLAAIVVFTRLATPAEYGAFALVASVGQMCQSVLFFWIQVGATRHIDAARRDGTLDALRSAVYRSHALTFCLFALVYLGVLGVLPLGETARGCLWWAVPMVGLRSLVTTNQAFHRGELRAARYNAVECAQALLQLGLAVALLRFVPDRTTALLAGTAAASLAVLVPEVAAVARALARPTTRAQVRSLLAFGLPLSASFALGYVLAASDRLLVEYFLGSAAVGVYSVAYGLMDRAVGSLFVAVSLAAFPLAIRAFEREGAAGASAQLRSNGRLLLAVTLPACALLMCLGEQLAGVMVGEAFRAEAAAIMPWIALAALLSGFQTHFFDHAFHLTRRTALFLWTMGPAALVNVAANVVLLPRLGLMGAVWATLAGYALSLAASVVVGARLLKAPLALGDIARALAASALMAAAVLAAHVPASIGGLAAACAIAAASYALAAFALDLGGLRARLLGLRALRRGSAS